MEDVIEIYALPLDEKNPVVCFDESPFQLLREVRQPMAGAPGRPRREDSEYERCGVAEVMMICQPAAGLRKCMVMEHRKKTDFAAVCKELDRMFPDAHKITLVCDNLNTHTKGALYATFPPEEARRLATKIEIRHTPKHGSWLNIAELEFAVLGRTVFNPDFPLACSSRVMGGEFDRQIELRGLIPKPLHPLSVLHGHCQIQDRLSAFCGGVGRLGK